MPSIEKFVEACIWNNVREVQRHIAEGVNINARNRNGRSGLSVAMNSNHVSTVKVLLACSDIRLDYTDLHFACFRNSVESIDLFLAHPLCTKQIVRMAGRKGMKGYTAQDWTNKRGSFRRIQEFLEKTDNGQTGNVGHENDEQATQKNMTLTEITDSIGRIETVEANLEQAKKSLEVEHKKEIKKLEEEHRRKLNETLDRHEKENIKSNKDLADTQSKKVALQAELQRKSGKHVPISNTSVSLIPECHICMEVMKPTLQIFNCDNGHLICSTCKPRVNRCHCTAVYRGRATAMEQMIRQIMGVA